MSFREVALQGVALPTIRGFLRYSGTRMTHDMVTMVGFFFEHVETNLKILIIMQIEGQIQAFRRCGVLELYITCTQSRYSVQWDQHCSRYVHKGFFFGIL